MAKKPNRSRRAAPIRGAAEPSGELIYGLRAGLAVTAMRPRDVLRIFCAAAHRSLLRRELAGIDSELITESTDQELARLAATKNHEGLCVVARPRRWVTPAAFIDLLRQQHGVAIALDRVRNPYNMGAILRSAAFFGLKGALLGAIAPQPALPADAIRVAEGGVEHLAVCRTTDLATTLDRLRPKGIHIVGADQHADRNLYELEVEHPAILVVGHEREGLSARARAACDHVVAIPGAKEKPVESLNVAVAAGVLMAEAMRHSG